jgi:hypothetical protein
VELVYVVGIVEIETNRRKDLYVEADDRMDAWSKVIATTSTTTIFTSPLRQTDQYPEKEVIR